MAQRDIGQIGSTFVDPSKDAVPAGFEGASTPIMARSTEPAPLGVPPGFDKLSVPTVGQSSPLSEVRSLPEPPDGYKPGYTAPVRQQFEDSMFHRIGSTLMDLGTKPGDMPVSMKIKLAQQEVDLKMSENKLAWDNYYKNNEVVRNLMQKQNKEAINDYFQVLPHFKAQISAINGGDPAEQQRLVDFMATSADSMVPGGGDFVRYFHKNQHLVYAMDAIASHPDASISGPVQEMIGRMGYHEAVKTKEYQAIAGAAIRDWSQGTMNRFPADMTLKLSKGDVDETEYRQTFKQVAMETGAKGPQLAAMLSFLDSPQGQAFMLAKGVSLDSIKVKIAQKEKPEGGGDADKAADREKVKSIIDFDTKFPGVLPAKTVQDAKDRLDIHMGLKAKESSPGQFSENKDVGIALLEVSNGEFGNPYQMMEGAQQGTPEHARRQKLLNKAMERNAELKPQAGLDAKMDTPHDFNEKPLFRLDKSGNLQRVKGPMSTGQVRGLEDTFTMKPDQVKNISELNMVGSRGKELFAQAEKAYKGKTTTEKMGELAAEFAMGNKATAAITANTHPDLFNYVSERDSALGKFARSLGGEVGVLTDQDIARVVRMFPNASDTAATRKAKQRAFIQLIELNKKALFTTLVSKRGMEDEGIVTPEELARLKEANRDKVNGILGSVEDLARRDAAALKGPDSKSKSLAEPSENPQPSGRGESLLEKMRKGK